MGEIIRGSTPVIKFTFSNVNPANISKAQLTIKDMDKNVIVTDTQANMTTGTDFVSWTLTQTQTLALPVDEDVAVMCDWLLTDGTRGRSNIVRYTVGDTGKNEAMT